MHMLGGVLMLALGVAPVGSSPPTAPPVAPAPPPAPVAAESEYVDDFQELSPEAREYERQQAPYTFCVRTTATYECPVYRQDGSLRHARKTATAHGTAFAFRLDGADTLLLTNDHVAEWPPATDDTHLVEGVPVGCRRVSDRLRIVDNDADGYERDDIPLTLAVADPALDIAVLRTHRTLPTMPWKMGRSALLRERNVVDVRGFPLGAFKANNVGKVISAYDRDDYKSWEHDDFVIDALLSPGNSGSPVFAISRKTGQLELVGVYHAGYTGGSALNLVVGIDQIRDLMTDLKRSNHQRSDETVPLDGQSRARFVDRVRAVEEAYFPLGALAASVRALPGGALLYVLRGSDFPLQPAPIAVIEDLPPDKAEAFGVLGRVWFGNAAGLKSVARAALDADSQAQLMRVLDALRHDGTWALEGRALELDADTSRDHFEKKARFTRAFKRGMATRQELTQSFEDLAGKLGPQESDRSVSLASILSPPPEEAPATPPTPPAAASTTTVASAKPDGASAPPAAPPRSPGPPAGAAASPTPRLAP
jgi:serine protease Do